MVWYCTAIIFQCVGFLRYTRVGKYLLQTNYTMTNSLAVAASLNRVYCVISCTQDIAMCGYILALNQFHYGEGHITHYYLSYIYFEVLISSAFFIISKNTIEQPKLVISFSAFVQRLLVDQLLCSVVTNCLVDYILFLGMNLNSTDSIDRYFLCYINLQHNLTMLIHYLTRFPLYSTDASNYILLSSVITPITIGTFVIFSNYRIFHSETIACFR